MPGSDRRRGGGWMDQGPQGAEHEFCAHRCGRPTPRRNGEWRLRNGRLLGTIGELVVRGIRRGRPRSLRLVVHPSRRQGFPGSGGRPSPWGRAPTPVPARIQHIGLGGGGTNIPPAAPKAGPGRPRRGQTGMDRGPEATFCGSRRRAGAPGPGSGSDRAAAAGPGRKNQRWSTASRPSPRAARR